MAVMAQEILSATIKAKLLIALPSIIFLNDDEVKRYRCAQCDSVAIYHYIATCKHIFCGKCHSSVSNKACPVENCPNPSINKIAQDKEFEFGVYNLKVQCMFKERGCNEIITLKEILDHKVKCKFSTNNLLPKLWKPSLKDMEYMMEEFSKLKRAIEEMQPDKIQSIEKLMKWELEKLRSTFDLKLDKSMKLVQKIESQMQLEKDKEKRIQKDMDMLQSSFELKLTKVRDDLLDEVSSKLAQKTEHIVQEVEKKLMGQMTYQKSKIQTDLQQMLSAKWEKMTSSFKKNNSKAMENFKEDLKCSFAKDIETKAKVEVRKINRQMKALEKKITGEITEQKSDLQQKLSEESKKSQNQSEVLQKTLTELMTVEKSNLQQMLSAESQKMENQRQELEDKFTRQMTDQKSDLQQTLSAEYEQTKKELMTSAEFISSKLNSEVVNRNIANITKHWIEQNSYKFMWNIEGINAIVKDFKSGKITKSKCVLLKTEGQKLAINVALNYSLGYVPMEAKLLMTDPNSSEHKKYYDFYQTEISIIDKSDGIIRRNLCRINDHPFEFSLLDTHSISCGRSISIRFLEEDSRYVKDDVVHIEIRLIPNSILDNFYQSDNGILLWKIYNYKEMKQDLLDDVRDYLESDAFYTMERGYRTKMYIDFIETHLFIYQKILKGKYDKSLSKEFPHKISLTIFDQSDSSEKVHLIRTTEDNTVDFTRLFLFDCEEIEKSKYLKNDCLLMQIIVEHTK